MPMTAHEIETIIRKVLPEADIIIHDLAGDGDHYACEVTSPVFEGMTRVKQHKLIYDAFDGKMGTELHALSVKTRTP